MRKLAFAAVVLIAAGFATDGRAADKVRLASRPLTALSVREQHRRVRPLSHGLRTLGAA